MKNNTSKLPSSLAALLLVLSAALSLAACGASQNARPVRCWAQHGLAVYYSDVFQGRETASGEPYDREQYTAAHRELPFGTVVRVTRLKTGSSVQLRINDRGPSDDPRRIIDIAHVAARDLGMVREGVVPVKVEVMAMPDGRRCCACACEDDEASED